MSLRRLQTSFGRPLDVHLTLGGFTITSKAGPNWTLRDVQFGRTYLVAFGPSNGRPLDALIGLPLVLWTSYGRPCAHWEVNFLLFFLF